MCMTYQHRPVNRHHYSSLPSATISVVKKYIILIHLPPTILFVRHERYTQTLPHRHQRQPFSHGLDVAPGAGRQVETREWQKWICVFRIFNMQHALPRMQPFTGWLRKEPIQHPQSNLSDPFGVSQLENGQCRVAP